MSGGDSQWRSSGWRRRRRASWWTVGDSQWRPSEWLRRRRTSWWTVGEDGVGQAYRWRTVSYGYRRLLTVEQHQRGLRLLVVAGLVGR